MDMYDDGLVHAHAWARETPAARPDRLTPAPHEAGAGHDDGLVHDHGWACRERGAPAR